MMLYIFLVDTGTMMTFEMNLALETVSHLKAVIERACRIPPEKQVLLVSGGESLEPTARVCSYSAGTDTNPIFLFSKCTIESVSPPSPSIDYGTDMDFKEQVEASLAMSASYNTVVVRAQLAQQLHEIARDQTRICERLVHDQHLQQQGWAAVVANLEDSVSVFRSRGEVFEQSYQQHVESRSQYMEVLANFQEVLNSLSKIPILPGLMASATESMDDPASRGGECSPEGEEQLKENLAGNETEHMSVSKKSDTSCVEDWSGPEDKGMTLLQWISTKGNQSTLEQMVEQCARGLEQFDERVIEVLRADVESALEAANKVDMKEIKGLEERLFGLEQLMFECKRVVQEQSDLATAFHQNQTRANNLGDASILPDLCSSHRRQLKVMLNNHHHLRDIRRRCNKAKEELSINLYHRLRWIMYVENRMCDVAGKLMIYNENLKRLRRHFEVIRQIQMAPEMYVCAVGEVVRRRTFSQAFLSWARDLASQLQRVHCEELARRREFHSRFEGHFLNTLFSGMEDSPPPFATQAPPSFDACLPKLSMEDVERLKAEVPNLAMRLSLCYSPNFADIFNVCLGRNLNSVPTEDVAIENALVTAVTSSKLNPANLVIAKEHGPCTEDSNSPCSLPFKDDRGFESETDTEEFEKVGQSPVDVAPSNVGGEGIETKSESNQLSDRAQAEKSHAQFQVLKEVVSAATGALHSELNQLREQLKEGKDEFMKLVNSFRAAWEQLLCAYPLEQAFNLEAQLQQEKISREAKDNIIRDLTLSVEKQTVTVEMLEASLRQRLKNEEEQRAQTAELQRCLENATSNSEQSDLAHCTDLQSRLVELEESRLLCEDLKKSLDDLNKRSREDLRRALENQQASLELTHKETIERIKAEAECEKNRALKELSDQLSRDHQSQLEGLRSRFRLMACTSTERSPSESSLEKMELSKSGKSDFDMESFVREKELAIQTAVQETEKRLQAEWESKLLTELQNVRLKMEAEKQVWFNEAMREVLEDNKRQIEVLRDRETILKKECQQHQETIQRLADDNNSVQGNLESKGQLFQLLDRVDQLESELATAKTQASMGLSVAVVPSENVLCRDAATSPEPLSLKRNLTSSANNLVQQGKINILSCMPGDAVLVVWNDTHQNYVILQESSTLFFVHSDCLESLGLSLTAEENGRRKIYSTAEVVEKEYCHARKSENRYHVPKGAKFYRVKVKPLQEDFMSKSCHRHKDRHQLQLQQPSHQHPHGASFQNENVEVSQCAASGPPSVSGCSSRERVFTEASQ